MRLSRVNPYELKKETVSISAKSVSSFREPSDDVYVRRSAPDEDEPTASEFFEMAGELIVHALGNCSKL